MIFIPSRLPKSEPTDFSKTYDPMMCNPETAKTLQRAGDLRNQFYFYFEGVHGKGSHEIVENCDKDSLLNYLNCGPDLVNINFNISL